MCSRVLNSSFRETSHARFHGAQFTLSYYFRKVLMKTFKEFFQLFLVIFEKIDDTERRLAVPQLKHLEINCCSGCRFSSYYKIRIQDSRRTKRGRKWELSKGEGEDESDDADSLQCLTSAADERQDGMVPCVLSTLHCYETS